ncbi:MAG TPA: beta-ketoacyl-ACP synthase II, partial [Edaphobacter sp.]|nr:beta-ketoacyl-ACP synthase II [Edaphobacter sp.]
MEQRRVVVTGLGLICGVGNTVSEVWQGLLAGKSGMAEIKAFDLTGHPVRFAAEVKNFDPLQFIDKKEARKMGRFIHLAIAAADEAMKHSGLQVTPEIADRFGVHIGSGIGGFDVIEREHSAMLAGGPRKISPFFIPGSIVNLAAGHVSIRYNAKGPNEATATACTSSAHSIGDAFRIIQRGDADAMIAGGTEAAITPMGVGGFAAMKALSTRNEDPEHACRPFDKDRDGFVVGEGAGILIMEELEFAKARGAHILAEVIGYGMSADAFHMTGMAPEGEGCFRAMSAALKVAGISPDKIDYVNAHATSTPLGDALESQAIENVFGERAKNGTLLVSSTKSMTGHLLGGAGGLEAGITIMAMLEQTAPPTMNIVELDPQCRLNYVPNKPQAAKIDY